MGSKPKIRPFSEMCPGWESLVNILSHGSGIDVPWTVELDKRGDCVYYNAFHRMNDVGMYCGWIPFHVHLSTTRTAELVQLKWQMEGMFQITRLAEKPWIAIHGFRERDNLADYLYDSLVQALEPYLWFRIGGMPRANEFSILEIGTVTTLANMCDLAKFPRLADAAGPLCGQRLSDAAALELARACRKVLSESSCLKSSVPG